LFFAVYKPFGDASLSLPYVKSDIQESQRIEKCADLLCKTCSNSFDPEPKALYSLRSKNMLRKMEKKLVEPGQWEPRLTKQGIHRECLQAVGGLLAVLEK
jgi:hypothetical protein